MKFLLKIFRINKLSFICFFLFFLISCTNFLNSNSSKIIDLLNRISNNLNKDDKKNIDEKIDKLIKIKIGKTGFIQIMNYKTNDIYPPIFSNELRLNNMNNKKTVSMYIHIKDRKNGMLRYKFLDKNKILFFKEVINYDKVIILCIDEDELRKEMIYLEELP
jgi:hypothetical protein